MKFIFVLLVSFNFLACSTKPNGAAPQQDRSYISHNLYSELKGQIPDFPATGSAAQKADEAQLRQYQKSRTKVDCERASTEVVVTLKSFFGKPFGELNDQQIALLQPLFDQIRIDGGQYIGQVKNAYSRLRPYDYIKDLKPCLSKEPTFAYPSGHATLASLYSLVLIDIFPNEKETLTKRAQQISQDRIIGGVHHPSDIESGNKLGEMVHAKLILSPAYNDDIQTYKDLLTKANLNTF